MENHMVLDSIFGFAELIIKDNLYKALGKDKGYGLASMEINILGILAVIERMDMVNIFG